MEEIEENCGEYDRGIVDRGDFNEIAILDEQLVGADPNLRRCNMF